MARNTGIRIDTTALQHNAKKVRSLAPRSAVIAMVKANAYGCGVDNVCPAIDTLVDAFGVACMEEAMALQNMRLSSPCMLFEGVFDARELALAAQHNMHVVLHSLWQLRLVLTTPLAKHIKLWIKVNTGMNRLGFSEQALPEVFTALRGCTWVSPEIGVMSHFACADTPSHPLVSEQLSRFVAIQHAFPTIDAWSMANSAAILTKHAAHFQWVRPGIMLYGVSPFADTSAKALDLRPVMHFYAQVLCTHQLSAGDSVGYGARWVSPDHRKIAVVTAGYGDGYPRSIRNGTMVAIEGKQCPLVGTISMDMLTVDITDCPEVTEGDGVELWGKHVPIEHVAEQAGTIPYELLCRFKSRV